ncbi:MKRN2 ligase, partial [Hypocryptadius cinnamomeus]|nr:MKRN2 ligase [Hypocryptadius cinnamomeus]
MSTKQVTCRYFLQGVCREGSKCLFSHDLATSKSSTVCKYYQKGQCAYGSRCRCVFHPVRAVRAAGAGGEAGSSRCSSLLLIPGHSLGTFSSASGQSALLVREKRTLVLRDRNLCGSSEEKPRPSAAGAVPCCSEPGDSEEAKPHSYLEAICSGLEEAGPGGCPGAEQQLCPYAAAGACHFGERCLYLHGQLCEICGLQVLHPFDQEQRKAHEMMCMATFEHDMERAFAIQASQDKVCSICMEVVYEKPSASERRFGILSNCTHTYCLSCIRQWRCAKQFENPIIK